MKERKNVYKLPNGDRTLEWYSRAVLEMKTRPATDPTSWYYQAGMHNYDRKFPHWQTVTPIPPKSERDEYWDKCQHGSWYFLPWHRMYLAYFEQIVAKTISDLGGPEDWALPFWDYSDSSNPLARNIPNAFLNPASETNGLWIVGRQNNSLRPNDVSLVNAFKPTVFSNSGLNSPSNFGGSETAPGNHQQRYGSLENTPHGSVHVAVGGAMGHPITAGLDPLFWLHHANIDRLWQVWLNLGNNRVNPVRSSWLDVKFYFHDKNRNRVEMKPAEVLDTRDVLTGYTYQEVSPELQVFEMQMDILRTNDFTMPLEVVAATNKKISLTSSTTVVSLKLTPAQDKEDNFKFNAVIGEPRVASVLHFENVTGKGTPPTQDIYLNVPDGLGNKEAHYAGSLSLFGVEQASKPSLHNSGNGQNYTLDVSELMNNLRSLPNWKEDQLDISIEPARDMNDNSSVKIGRISLYSE